ncbi:MAG TPA: hypothetical protein VM532_00740, partial [Burkholderiales bacterium]|nr:hypothetical protein [Burkholderiales bacterium]
ASIFLNTFSKFIKYCSEEYSGKLTHITGSKIPPFNVKALKKIIDALPLSNDTEVSKGEVAVLSEIHAYIKKNKANLWSTSTIEQRLAEAYDLSKQLFTKIRSSPNNQNKTAYRKILNSVFDTIKATDVLDAKDYKELKEIFGRFDALLADEGDQAKHLRLILSGVRKEIDGVLLNKLTAKVGEQPVGQSDNPVSSLPLGQKTIGGLPVSSEAKAAYDSLEGKEWLADDAMQILPLEIFEQYREGILELQSYGVNIAWLPPSTTRMLLQPDYDDQLDFDDAIKNDPGVPAPASQRQIVFMPLNDSRENVDQSNEVGTGSHWQLVVCDRTEEGVTYYGVNSLNEYANDVALDVINKMEPGFSDREDDDKLTPRECPEQEDGSQCGVYVLRNIDALLRKIIQGAQEGYISIEKISIADYGEKPLTRSDLQEMVIRSEERKAASKKVYLHPRVDEKSPLRAAIARATSDRLSPEQIFIKEPSRDFIGKVIYSTKEFVYLEPVSDGHKGDDGVLPIYAVPHNDPARLPDSDQQDLLSELTLYEKGPVPKGGVVEVTMIERYDNPDHRRPGSVTLKSFGRCPLPEEKVVAPFMPGIDKNGPYILYQVAPPPSSTAGEGSSAVNQPDNICKVYEESLRGTGKTINLLTERIKKNKGKPWKDWSEEDRRYTTVNFPPLLSKSQTPSTVEPTSILKSMLASKKTPGGR